MGLLRLGADPAVYEAALGVVDPLIKASGLFGRVFEETMAVARELPMRYCLLDFVTNHDYSQRLISRYGPRELALLVGCQSRSTQCKLERIGIGKDPPGMDRYSILVSALPRASAPFGREVVLPNGVGERLGFLLEPLGLGWSPAPRFDLLPAGGEFLARYQPGQGAVVFELFEPGREALRRIVAEWRRLLREGYQYAGVEAPLGAPGVASLHRSLAEEGFFLAGFTPWRFSDRLALRLQSIAPAKVAFDHLRVHSPAAKRLLEVVREDYRRNRRL